MQHSPLNSLNKINTNNSKSTSLFVIFGVFVALVAIIYGAYYLFVLSNYITTNNAYVGAEIAQVTSSTSGIVKIINYRDADVVKVGDILVIIEDTDAKLVLAKVKANLMKAEVDLDRSKMEYDRRLALAKSGSVSVEEVSNAKNTYQSAQAIFDSIKVMLDQAQIDLDRTIVRSPVNGIIAKRQVQLGQYIQSGKFLMSVVPVDNLYVNANFKEVQLKEIKIGQPVDLISDLYGGKVIYHGKVSGIAGGTGAAFAVIPAQNATGNWIKVVQRLPVRIDLDPKELKEHPLQVGLSMNVEVDISGDKK